MLPRFQKGGDLGATGQFASRFVHIVCSGIAIACPLFLLCIKALITEHVSAFPVLIGRIGFEARACDTCIFHDHKLFIRIEEHA